MGRLRGGGKRGACGAPKDDAPTKEEKINAKVKGRVVYVALDWQAE